MTWRLRRAGPGDAPALSLVAAASFIGLLPVIAAFLVLQRFFVAGLTAGATKG